MHLIGVSARKCGGKDCVARFVRANAQLFFGWRRGVDGLDSPRPREVSAGEFNFADRLKEFIASFLGVSREALWGSDLDKETLTDLRWEDMPHYERLRRQIEERNRQGWHDYVGSMDPDMTCDQYVASVLPVPSGFMTARQVMQQVGEGVLVAMRPSVFTDGLAEFVRGEGGGYDALTVADVRKPAEVRAVQALGGKVIRLLRAPHAGTDLHSSETALDGYTGFDAVIDNAKLSVVETNKKALVALRRWGWVVGPLDLDKVDWEPAA